MNRISSVVVAGLILILFACGNHSKDENKNGQNQSKVNNDFEAGKITIGASEESFDLAQRMASSYVAQNTNIIIEVIPCKANELQKALASGQVQLVVTGGISNPLPKYTSKIIACDVMVLAVNFNNPCLQYLAIRGLDLKELQSIFTSGTITNWNQVDKKSNSTPIKPLIGPDSTSSNFLVRTLLQSGLSNTVTSTMTENELVNSMSSSLGIIAFLSHRKAYNQSSGFKASGIYIIPVDVNSNNVADDAELIFDDLNMIGKAYKKGHYPKSLVRNHYFIYSDKAERVDIIKHFAEYASKSGTNIISTSGYFEPLK